MSGDPILHINKHQTKMPHSVTLSEAKGLARWAKSCFAVAQHDS